MKKLELELHHCKQNFQLNMSDGSVEIREVSNDISVSTYDYPTVYNEDPESVLKHGIKSGYCASGINYAQVVSYLAGEVTQESTEIRKYEKHWFWGWRRYE